MDLPGSFDPTSSTTSMITRLEKLQDVVRQTRKDLGPKDGPAITAHPFGHVNIRQVREEMAGAVADMRSILTDHRDMLASVGDSGMSEVNSLRNLLSSFKGQMVHDLATDQARIEAGKCRDAFLAGCTDKASRDTRIFQAVEKAALSLGLQFYGNTGEGDGTSSAMIAGNILVLDMESTHNGRFITKVAYANGDNASPALNHVLARRLEQEDVKGFTLDLALLSVPERLANDFESQEDLSHSLNALQKDLASFYPREAFGSLATVLNYGHGLPLPDILHPGPGLAYWASAPTLLTVEDWESVNRAIQASEIHDSFNHFHRVHFTLERTISQSISEESLLADTATSTSSLLDTSIPSWLASDADGDTVAPGLRVYQVVAEDDSILLNSPPRWLEPTIPKDGEWGTHFKAILEPPVLLTQGVVRELAALIHQDLGDAMEVGGDGPEGLESSPALLSALYQEFSREGGERKVDRSTSVTHPTMLIQGSSWIHDFDLQAPSHEPVYQVSQVPFTAPRHFFQVMRLIRRHLEMNQLLKSCHGYPVSDSLLSEEERATMDHIPITVRPSPFMDHLTVRFTPPRSSMAVHLEVRMDPSTSLTTVRRVPFPDVTEGEGEEEDASMSMILNAVCHAEKMDEVLRRTGSLGLLVYWLLKRFEEQSDF
ncbi:hypothetical protein BJ684DRAFT_20815 [Piptocephalis cylindrospora]|uniref:Mediator of RNA polymerase II transcription subunit 1 n=1 Tax=Piptocephalis cylindrospora TaxID=1907219 RepID=A0A4P9Y3G9_9FUNG|nr:hypothetical protein BJ684DRAFT_20815 [Piptocephalis cylindrospora]|eukprot:RKP12661.1 hypothetical protein BJ684DRAFT_20815 [Piptocephalis cylindrospora]